MDKKGPMNQEEQRELEKTPGNLRNKNTAPSKEDERPIPSGTEEEFQGYRPNCKRNPRKRRSGAMGTAALLCSLFSVLLMGAVLLNLYFAYGAKTLVLQDVRIARIGVIAAAVLAVLGLLLGGIALFLRRQKKGLAITGMILSVIMILASGTAIYTYQYIFGALSHQEVEQEKLHQAEVGSEGEIVRETEEDLTTLASEDMESLMEEKRKQWGEDVSWEFLTDEQLPEEALEKMDEESQLGTSYLLDGHERISNYLLLGIDRQESSDALMICTVDRVHHKIKLISIPRDSYVLIPEFGTYAKLTYAFFWGGAPWTIGTINRNFNMNISDYVAVEIEQMEKIVDLVGGVDVDLDYGELQYLPYAENLHYGICHLNGKQAVKYARLRELDNEINRTGRQREVIMSILEALSRMPVTDYPAFIRECLGMSETSFQSDELLELSMEVLQNHYTVEEYALINQLDYWGGKLGEEQYFYVVYDLNKASDLLYRIIYEDLYVSGYKN